MLKAAHQRKFDIVVFWALDRLTRAGTRATLNYLQRLESKGVGYVSYTSSCNFLTSSLSGASFCARLVKKSPPPRAAAGFVGINALLGSVIGKAAAEMCG